MKIPIAMVTIAIARPLIYVLMTVIVIVIVMPVASKHATMMDTVIVTKVYHLYNLIQNIIKKLHLNTKQF